MAGRGRRDRTRWLRRGHSREARPAVDLARGRYRRWILAFGTPSTPLECGAARYRQRAAPPGERPASGPRQAQRRSAVLLRTRELLDALAVEHLGDVDGALGVGPD